MLSPIQSKKVRRVSGAKLSSWLGLRPKRDHEEDEDQHPYGQRLSPSESRQQWASKSAHDLSAPKWPRVSIGSLSFVWKNGKDDDSDSETSPYLPYGREAWRISAPQLVKTEAQRSFSLPEPKQPNPQRHTIPAATAILASWDNEPEDVMSSRRHSYFDAQSVRSVPNSLRSSKYEFRPPNRLSDPRASGIIESLRSTSMLFSNTTPLQRRPAIKRRRHEDNEATSVSQSPHVDTEYESDDHANIISDDGQHSFVRAQEDIISVVPPSESRFDEDVNTNYTNWLGPERAIVAPAYEPLPLSSRLPLSPIISSIIPAPFGKSKAQSSPKQQQCPKLTITLPPPHETPLTPPATSRPIHTRNSAPIFNFPRYDDSEKPVFDHQKRSFTEPLRPVSLPTNIPRLVKRKTVPTETFLNLAKESDLGIHPSQRVPFLDDSDELFLPSNPTSRSRRQSRSQLPSTTLTTSTTLSPPQTPRSVSTSWDTRGSSSHFHSRSLPNAGPTHPMAAYSPASDQIGYSRHQ